MKNKKMVMNLGSSFLMGLLAFYIFSGTITLLGVLVCLASVGLVFAAYMAVYLIRKVFKQHHEEGNDR